ncbi:hypothetical protein [Collinsella intestinalis]|uniref:hypothetical protein n=1 Tax=Collinsella intestinalis TaxID=147207 RepID=UPI0025A35D32|nr:hypothetical protein [Collinsella intestinalis]MDM8162612.1 hypothetical protein [Collinsella intestinalis]
MDVIFNLLIAFIFTACPVIPLIMNLPVFGGAFIGFIGLSEMSGADFLGCFVTVASGFALITPMVFRAVKGDIGSRRRLCYVVPVFVAASSGMLSIMLSPTKDGGSNLVPSILGGICILAMVLAALLYIVIEHEGWGPAKKGGCE